MVYYLIFESLTAANSGRIYCGFWCKAYKAITEGVAWALGGLVPD